MEPTVTDWISAISALVATLITGFTAWFAYKQYLEPPKQEQDPDSAKDVAADLEKRDLTVFDTSKQRTLLKVAEHGLECWLPDKRTKSNKLQWTISKEELSSIITENDYIVTSGHKARTGLFKIGKRRNWLYSKNLFPEPEYLHGALSEIMKRAL